MGDFTKIKNKKKDYEKKMVVGMNIDSLKDKIQTKMKKKFN